MATKKKSASIDPNIAILGGVAILGYVGVLNPLLKFLGIKKDDDTKQQEQQQQAAVLSTKAQLIKAGMKQFRTDAQLSNCAEIIHQALRYSSLDDDKEKAGAYLCYVQNDLDVMRLIELFGVREEAYFGVFSYRRSLGEFVTSNLSSSKIAAVNANYASKKIFFRW